MTTRTAPAPELERLDPALLRLGGVLVLGAVLALLDATVVSVGINAIRRDLHSGVATIGWVSTGYLLALALVAPLSGWASERFGAKRTWMTAVGLFVAGSALCGVAWSAGSLIAFRVLQGLGGGLIQPIGQSMLAQAAGPGRLGRVMGLLILPLTFAPVLGPVVGGVLVDTWGWPWIFYVNVPVGAATLALAARVLPADRPGGGQRLDTLGVALLSPSVAALVYGFSEAAGDGGFGATRVVVALSAGVALLAGYVRHALRRDDPLLDLSLFARRRFSVAVVASFLLGASLYGSMFLLPLFFQQVRGQDALHAGLLTVPQDLGIAVAAVFSGRFTDRIGPRTVVLSGVLLALAGTVVYTQVAHDPPAWLLAAALAVRGVGVGATMTPAMAAVFQSVERAAAPRAASANNVLHRVGGSIGTAVLAVVLQGRLHAGPAAGFAVAFWCAVAISALAAIPGALLPGRPSRGR